MSGQIRREPNNPIDRVLGTQPELGPIIPEGGFGWIVFVCTLFFQLLIPSLLVSFGVFLAFSRLKNDIIDDTNPKLWDHTMLHVPLGFVFSWTLFDPTCRRLISQSKWPKLFAIGGTCLICAGILFIWMGMTGGNQAWLFCISGLVTGLGSSIQMAQCEILLAQYFRLKLPILIHLGHACASLGFIFAPVILGSHLMVNSQTQIILWYQAIVLQGLVVNLFLRKPLYLKSSKNIENFNYITANPDDEEDILSKNARELQITVQNQNGVQIQTHELPQSQEQDGPSNPNVAKKEWVQFEDEEDEATKYERVQQWETFEEETGKQERNNKSLQLELAFGEEAERPVTRSINGLPIPLFSDTPVNNNTSYAYDALDQSESAHAPVFQPTTHQRPLTTFTRTTVDLLKTPSFYKTLVTVMTTRWSCFVFFSLYPSFLFQEVKEIHIARVATLVGSVSTASLIFAGGAYWINVEKKWRAKVIWGLSWMGALGYFMISDYFSQAMLLFGAVQIVLSIAALQHVATPLLGLTIKGEATAEYSLISIMTAGSFLFFFLLNSSFKQIFRLMSLLNFFTGSLWLSNYIYKRLR